MLSQLFNELGLRLNCDELENDIFGPYREDVSGIMNDLNMGKRVNLRALSGYELVALIIGALEFAHFPILPSDSESLHAMANGHGVYNVDAILRKLSRSNLLALSELMDYLYAFINEWNKRPSKPRLTHRFMAQFFISWLVFREKIDASWAFLESLLHGWPNIRLSIPNYAQTAQEPETYHSAIDYTPRRHKGQLDYTCWKERGEEIKW